MTRIRPALLRGIHLAVLWAVAGAQPIFDLVGRNAEFFVARGNRPVDIVVLTVGLVVVPPAALWCVELAAGALAPDLGEALHRLFVGGLVALLALYVMKRLDVEPGTGVALAMAVLVGAAGVFAYVRFRAPSAFLTVLAPAPLLFAGIFLLGSPVTKLVFPDAQASVAEAAGQTRTPVIVLLLDELPLTSMLDDRGRIDPVRYPNFAALARDATWYRNAAGVSDATQFAVPGVLTGVRPDKDDLPIASDHPDNIFTLFGESHLPVVTEPVTELCTNCSARESEPAGDRLRSLASDISVAYLHLVAPDGVRRSLPPVDRGWKDFGHEAAPAQPDAAGAAVAGHLLGTRKRFLAGSRSPVSPRRCRPAAARDAACDAAARALGVSPFGADLPDLREHAGAVRRPLGQGPLVRRAGGTAPSAAGGFRRHAAWAAGGAAPERRAIRPRRACGRGRPWRGLRRRRAPAKGFARELRGARIRADADQGTTAATRA